jgi:hypothetical protein
MFAARQRTGQLARQLPRVTRNYASDAHAHHKPHEVNESFGTGSLIGVGAFFGGVLLYQFSPKEGDNSSITSWLTSLGSRPEHWEEINSAHSLAAKQAGFDRNLFENAGGKQRYVDIAFPEAIETHASRNIRAGQLMNLDHVVEHYRQEHLKEEDRKAKKIAQEKA